MLTRRRTQPRTNTLSSAIPRWNLCFAVLLAACGGQGASTQNGSGQSSLSPPPAQTVASSGEITFTREPLDGFSGALSVVYADPPYLVGTKNDGSGHLTTLDWTALDIEDLATPPRVMYDIRAADFNNDGVPDFVSGVYSPTNIDSYGYLYMGTAAGPYAQQLSFGNGFASSPLGSGLRGRTETVVVADFNNDGTVDVFVPAYTYLDAVHDLSGAPQYFYTSGPPPNVYNAYQNLLLLNDGTGNFTEHAVEAGVSMHSLLSGIQPVSGDPDGRQPEGAQAVDFNMDGLIDLYAGGHLYINQGVDANGVPHFKDMAAEWGLTDAVLRQAPPWSADGSGGLPPAWLVYDEGIKFLDWNNDGHLDLLELQWTWGPAHGARLFEFDGTKFTERTSTVPTQTATCPTPPPPNTPFFSSSRPPEVASDMAGINAYDLDNDGLEDVLTSGDSTVGNAVFRNTGCGFVEVTAGDFAGRLGGGGGMALADFDGDGRIDVAYPEVDGFSVYLNRTPVPAQSSFTVTVLGPNGEPNQFGRVIQVFPPRSKQIMTRVVDGGSGYLTQNQYPILVGTPFQGPHTVTVYYAPLARCVYGGPPCSAVKLTFLIYPGQSAKTYAPSVSNPNGRVEVPPLLISR